ncbi:hypothetical protein PPACK8108_LOCUS24526 [Phakopsora pachyrhizi]|uniref:Uncharacterized protein n=1 Tax=Phakopsora pachyrhizi TaxID=170000 RepID=A0AAV0BRS3_PHAPC|nr:hypothetical protein PPACK8108_LOCUS24526 [Phakopsora pachyrhizi]
MNPLENNKQIPSPTIPCPTVSLLCPISSPSAFVNTNIGYITEHNERQHNDNSNDTSEDEDEQQTSPNLNNYQGTSTKSETNPVDINMEANQDPIFEGVIEVISKEAFLKNITMANRHLSLVIDNPSLPLYIQGKFKVAIDLLRVDEETALETSSGQDNNVLTVDNSDIIHDSKSIRINNPEIQAPQSLVEAQIPSQGVTLSIPETPTSSSTLLNTGNFSDLAININVIPEVQLPVPVSCLSKFFLQHEDVLIATLGNIYHSKSSSWQITLGSILALVKNRNSRIEGVDLPNYLPSGIEIKSEYGLDMFTAKSNEQFFSDEILNTTMLLDSNSPVSQRMIWANLLFESFHLFAKDIIAPATFEPQKVTTDNPLSVECALAGFLASCFSFNKNKSAVLPIKGLKGNEETIKDPPSGTFKNLNDFLDKIIHVLIAINMVQAHAKFQGLPSTSGSSTCPKGKGKASSSRIETVSAKNL